MAEIEKMKRKRNGESSGKINEVNRNAGRHRLHKCDSVIVVFFLLFYSLSHIIT